MNDLLGKIFPETFHFPIQSQSVNVALCFDLLEHIEKENMVLREISRVLKKDGKLILTTPMERGISFPFLTRNRNRKINFDWGHKRLGYTKNMLFRLFQENGLKADKFSGYFNILTRFIYRMTILSGIPYPFKSRLFNSVAKLEPYLKYGAQEHIIIGSKSKTYS